MTSPAPEERAAEAFADSAAEAMQTAVAVVRLVMAIADAARRHEQRRQQGKAKELPPSEEAVREVADVVRRMLPSGVSAALMREADWPHLAQQLLALRQAGVDLDQVLPRIGEIAVDVREQVELKGRDAQNERWMRAVREILPAGPLREAILGSAAWPDMVAVMSRLKDKGVDVRAVLAAAHNEVLSVRQAVAQTLGGSAEPATSRDAQMVHGPLTAGLNLPRDLDLSDREHALTVQLAISPQENAKYMRLVCEAMPGMAREADALVLSRQWPVLAARMARLEQDKEPVRERLVRLAEDTSWKTGQGPLGTRLVRAAVEALSRPPGHGAVESRTKVSTVAARATSPSMGPNRAAGKGAPPATAGVAARREAGPAPKSGRTR